MSVVNYRPEIRCTYRYEIQTLSRKTQTLYGKTFADDRGAEIQRRITYLYQRAENNPDSFVMARPLGYDATLHTVWLEGIDGKALVDYINDQNADKLMAQLAKHLVNFHSTVITGLEPISEDNLLAEIQKKLAKLQKAFPNLSERMEGVLFDLNKQLQFLPSLQNNLVHGDFHIEQLLLLDDNRMALFDFDELTLGNPLMDLANFSAALYTLNLSRHLTERLINQLSARYQALSGVAISDAHFEWHLRVQLLTRAYRVYIQQKPNLELLVDQFLTTAEIGSIKHTG